MGPVLQIAIIATAIVTIGEESKKATVSTLSIVKDSILLFQTFIGFDIALVVFGVRGIVSLLRDHVFFNNPLPVLYAVIVSIFCTIFAVGYIISIITHSKQCRTQNTILSQL
eukprot:UN13710